MNVDSEFVAKNVSFKRVFHSGEERPKETLWDVQPASWLFVSPPALLDVGESPGRRLCIVTRNLQNGRSDIAQKKIAVNQQLKSLYNSADFK